MKKYPLTTPQQNILNLQEFYPDSAISNQCGAVVFDAVLNLDRLTDTLKRIVIENDVFHIRLTKEDGIKQYFCNEDEITRELADTIGYKRFADELEMDAFSASLAQTPMEIYDAALYRFVVFTLADGRTGVIALLNHLISDAWSFGLLVKKVNEIYDSGPDTSVDENKYSYTDFIRSENDYILSSVYARDKEYWEKVYEKNPDRTPIHITETTDDIISKRYVTAIDESRWECINTFCAERNISPAILFETALCIYLYRINREISSVTIGLPVLNRRGINDRNTVGMFISTIPLTVEICGDMTLSEFMYDISSLNTSSYRHIRYPYPDISGYVKKKHNLTGNLYDVMFSFQNVETGVKARTKWYFNGYSEVPLMLHIDNRDGKRAYTLTADYQVSAFKSDNEIKSLLNSLETVLMQLISTPEMQVNTISVVSDAEYRHIVNDFNDTHVDYPREKCVHELFTEQAKTTPDQTALVFEDKSFTYEQLDKMSDALAYHLRNLGVERNDIVPIIAKRDWRIIVAMLGVLKAGGAYMPVSPDYPAERIRTMLDIAKSKIVLTYGYDAGKLSERGNIKTDEDATHTSYNDLSNEYDNDYKYIDLNDFDFNVDTLPVENVNSPDDICYIIFTSGSTGIPKGIVQSHKCITNLISYQLSNYSCDGKRVLGSTILSFDVSVQEIMYVLLGGGHLILTNDDIKADLIKYAKYLKKYDIDYVFITPSYFNMFPDIENTWKGLSTIFFAGEDISVAKEKIKILPKTINVVNQYGPAEAHVVSERIITDAVDSIIGKPIANTQIYILDDTGHICPIGVAGELCIAGDGVGKGYLNNPELTAEKFIPNPFATAENGHGKVMYRTGDLARWREDGEIEYLGRIDTQVKIRGLRIELGEIESVMSTFPNIGLTAAAAKKDANGRQYLVGYYTVNSDAGIHTTVSDEPYADTSNADGYTGGLAADKMITDDNAIPTLIDEKALRKHLSDKLPKYMVPNYFVCLNEMPMTPSGKTDRKNLPNPDYDAKEATEYFAPETDTEIRLAEIWKELLKADRIGRTDDFFDLGGDSLLVISMVSRIGSVFGADINVSDVFSNPVLSDLAQIVDSANEAVHITSANTDRYELLPQQKEIYAACMKNPNSLIYNIPARLPIPADMDRDRLIRCVADEMNSHRNFKIHITYVGDTLYAVYAPDTIIGVETFSDENADDFFRPFDLSESPTVRIGLTDRQLLIDMHHITADGTTLSILLDNIMLRMNGQEVGESKLWYGDYAEYYRMSDKDIHCKFWRDIWKYDINPIMLPETDTGETGGKSEFYTISEELFTRVHRVAHAAGVTDTGIFLGAYGILLSRYCGKREVISSIIIQNRAHTDIRHMAGMFVNTLPIHFDVGGSLSGYLTSVMDMLMGLYTHQEFSMAEIRETLCLHDAAEINTAFVYQADGVKTLAADNRIITPEWVETDTNKFDLLMELTPSPDGCRLRFEYDRSKYTKKLMDRLNMAYTHILRQFADNVVQDIGDISVLSDAEYRHIINDFNDTHVDYPREKCVHELFAEQAKTTPDKVALVFEDQEFTYRQLDEMSNSLAHHLRNMGVKRNVVVPIISKRDWRIIVAMLGVLKAGGAYMPVSPDYPADRIRTMLDIAKSKVVLTYGYDAGRLSERGNIKTDEDATHTSYNDLSNEYEYDNDYKYIDLNDFDFNADTLPVENINSPDDCCYIIFTSGSTGKPKGIKQIHKCLTNLICWQGTNYPCEGKKVLAATTLAFDVSIQEIMYSLLGGGELFLTSDDVKHSIYRYSECLKEYCIDYVFTTPSYFNMFSDIENTWKGINAIFFAGEDISIAREKILRLPKTVKAINQYGPAETHVVSDRIIANK